MHGRCPHCGRCSCCGSHGPLPWHRPASWPYKPGFVPTSPFQFQYPNQFNGTSSPLPATVPVNYC